MKCLTLLKRKPGLGTIIVGPAFPVQSHKMVNGRIAAGKWFALGLLVYF